MPGPVVISIPMTIMGVNCDAQVERVGDGPIPILLCGHAEVYLPQLYNAFKQADTLAKYSLYAPRTYWCTDAPLSSLSLEKFTMDDLVDHLEQIRSMLASQGLLKMSDDKIVLYGHSFFHRLAVEYAIRYPQNILFMHLDAPPPYCTAEWAEQKAQFFVDNASDERQQILAAHGIKPSQSAVNEEIMSSPDCVVFYEAYDKMAAILLGDELNALSSEARIEKIWGKFLLNMAMMKHYFSQLMPGYDIRNYLNRLTCPYYVSLGMQDGVVPPYLWTDQPDCGAVGLFSRPQPKADYQIFEAGHWPYLERPEETAIKFHAFMMTYVLPILPRAAQEQLENKVVTIRP